MPRGVTPVTVYYRENAREKAGLAPVYPAPADRAGAGADGHEGAHARAHAGDDGQQRGKARRSTAAQEEALMPVEGNEVFIPYEETPVGKKTKKGGARKGGKKGSKK